MEKGVFVGELSAVTERLCSSGAQGTEILTGPGTCVRKELQKQEEENMCEIPSWSDLCPPSMGRWDHGARWTCSSFLLFYSVTYLQEQPPNRLFLNGYLQVHKHVLFKAEKQMQWGKGQVSVLWLLPNASQGPADRQEWSQEMFAELTLQNSIPTVLFK